MNQLEPVEYDQTHDLVDQCAANTPQSQHCGCIAQSVQSISELEHAVVVESPDRLLDVVTYLTPYNC
ncbi:MAG: hypothetical protein ACKPKO_13360, partial [Candidatus Fonsibacter sp.]